MIEILSAGDRSVPEEDWCLLERLLQFRATDSPDAVYARFADGQEWTYAQAWSRARRVAGALAGLGVEAGDTVLSWLPNGPEATEAVLSCAALGAIVVPINTAFRGSLLAHVLFTSGAKVMIAHSSLAERLDQAYALLDERPPLADVLMVDGDAAVPDGIRAGGWGALVEGAATWSGASNRKPWDPCAVLFTSGTTGPSKGVLTTSVQLYSIHTGSQKPADTPADRFLLTAPFCHQVGLGTLYRAALYGASVAIAPRFDTSSFWQTVSETGCTMATLVGGQATFLVRADGPDLGQHGLRVVEGSPVTEDFIEFGRRFRVALFTGFSMTELSMPIAAVPGTPPGSCGRVREGFEVRLVDEHDLEVPQGEPGELIVRAARPWSISTQYLDMPEASAAAWRNGWFHTGDLLRVDAEGNYFFVDRVKDCIRRRGENVSSYEVECELVAHPAVVGAAAVGVAGETGDQEILAVLQLAPGCSLELPELIDFLRPRLAHFMIPRYVRVVESLPVNSSNRVIKETLRSEGLAPGTLDREAAGVSVRSDRFPPSARPHDGP